MAENAEQLRAGTLGDDAETWRALLKRAIPMIYAMFVRRGINPGLAEELVQQTVFDAVRGRESFDAGKGAAEQWMLGIARNNLALEMRRRATRPSLDGDISTYLAVIDTTPLPDEVLEKTETARLVRAALDRLDDREQAVLRAKYLDDLSARTIAQRMGITEKAVHSLLYRARNSLREKLKTLRPHDKEEIKQ